MPTIPPDEPERTPTPVENTMAAAAGPATQVANPAAAPPHVRTIIPPWRPTVPGYEVRGEIARGGMGAVLAARELALDREVAIKVLLPGAAADAGRFVQEARITSRLQHPGIPPVYALGELPDGSPFLVMKLIKGRTLAAILAARGKTEPADPAPADTDLTIPSAPGLLQVFEQICQTVGFAHSHDVIHRDLKPGNVMVGPFGEVQVMDWGLAHDSRNADADQTQAPSPDGDSSAAPAEDDGAAAAAVLGTPAYMAPEQARGEPTDERTDVFALGGILCTILTGHPPFEGRDVRITLGLACMGEVFPAFERLAACRADAELISLAMRCLCPDPMGRPPSAVVVATEVAAYRAGVEERLRTAEAERAAAAALVEEATQRAEREAAKAAEQRKQGRLQLAVAVAVLVVVGLVIGLLWSADRRGARRDADRRVEQAVKAALARAAAKDGDPPRHDADAADGDAIPPPREVKMGNP
jgi:hypothetical protein